VPVVSSGGARDISAHALSIWALPPPLLTVHRPTILRI
jgi:hypothetical protein